MVVLWTLVVVLAVVSTVFLSLDTTAVIVTPVVVVLAQSIGVSPLPFALATVWLANTASLALPVSNLTNLLAAPAMGTALGVHRAELGAHARGDTGARRDPHGPASAHGLRHV